MVLKYIGLFLSFMFFTALGVFKSHRLSLRKEQINEILIFLNKISTSIRYKNDDIFSLVECCVSSSLAPLKNVNKDYGNYEKAISNLPFNKEDKALLKDFFSQLGTTDVEGQLSHIELYKEFFSEHYERAKSDIEKKSKLYRMSGLFAGLAFVVMFI
jgi:stage III sporulation protein AB